MKVEIKVRGTRTTEDGSSKVVKDLYLVDAVALTDAIAKIHDNVAEYYEDFTVIVAKEVAYSEVFVDDAREERFYKTKVNTLQIDERSGKEIKTAMYLILQANDLDDAKHRLEEERKKWLVDTEVEAISETKYLSYIA
jgi:hypothetical protein